MLLQKLLSFGQRFVIRLLVFGSLFVLVVIRNKLAALFLHEVRIRRIAICIRCNSTFGSSRATLLLFTVLVNTLLELGDVGVKAWSIGLVVRVA